MLDALAIYVLDDYGEAYNVFRYCSEPCRQMAVTAFHKEGLPIAKEIEPKTERLPDTVCDYCDRPLP